MPAALAVDWEQIKQAAIAGIPFPEIAQQWGMVDPETGLAETNAIRQRCFRESWPIPRAIMASASLRLSEAKAAQNAAQEQLRANGVNITTVTPPSVREQVSASLEQIAGRHPLKMASFLEKKLSAAIDGDTLPVPTSWKEANTADTMLRRAIGLDKPTVNVQVGVWSGSMGQDWADDGSGQGPIVETEAGNDPD